MNFSFANVGHFLVRMIIGCYKYLFNAPQIKFKTPAGGIKYRIACAGSRADKRKTKKRNRAGHCMGRRKK